METIVGDVSTYWNCTPMHSTYFAPSSPPASSSLTAQNSRVPFSLAPIQITPNTPTKIRSVIPSARAAYLSAAQKRSSFGRNRNLQRRTNWANFLAEAKFTRKTRYLDGVEYIRSRPTSAGLGLRSEVRPGCGGGCTAQQHGKLARAHFRHAKHSCILVETP